MSAGDDLRAVIEMLDPLGRDALRPVLIRDQADRDAVICPPHRWGAWFRLTRDVSASPDR